MRKDAPLKGRRVRALNGVELVGVPKTFKNNNKGDSS